MNKKKPKQLDITHNIQKRFQTSMIGSLARVEDYFGFMWGHDKDMISIEQSENRRLWEELREEILDHSNYQMRCAINDLKNYLDLKLESQHRYQEKIHFKFNKEDQEL